MDELVLSSVATLSGLGVVAASVLYVASRRFRVEEDPRIDEVEELLPGANCGGCSLTGCRAFAEAVVKAPETDYNNYYCPAGGNETLIAIADALGYKAEEKEPTVAVLKCNGSRENAPPKVSYDGLESCRMAHTVFAGESGCAYGCLGLADCVKVCDFDALYLDEKTGLPVVDVEKCTSCGACVKVCPRRLFEIWPRGKDDKRVFVACMNTEKGGTAKKNCSAACIACQRCTKIDGCETVEVSGNLARISPQTDVEKFGGLLVGACPTGCILGTNVKAQKPEKKAKKPKMSPEEIAALKENAAAKKAAKAAAKGEG